MCPKKLESWWEQCLVVHSVMLTVVPWGVKMVVLMVDQSVELVVLTVVQSVVQLGSKDRVCSQ